MILAIYLVCASVFIISLSCGLFIFLKPSLTIEIQRKFYEKINWKIEPISMAREVRNTKIMGLSIIIASLWFLVFILFRYIPR